MNFKEYEEKALSFRLPSASPGYALLNLVGEVGEFCSNCAKAIRDGTPDNFNEKQEKELGDILWHVTAVAKDLGLTLENVAAVNIQKLQDRADRGKIKGSGDER